MPPFFTPAMMPSLSPAWNSTASFDSAPVWDASAEFFAREGWSYVGVTNSNTPIAFLRGGCRLGGVIQVARCRQRYETLSLPENGQAYDVVSQIVHALRTGGASSPLPPPATRTLPLGRRVAVCPKRIELSAPVARHVPVAGS